MKTTIHHSEDIDSLDAIAEILAECMPSWADSAPQAGILYASIDHDLEVLQQPLMERWPGLELVGCSGNGQISSVRGTTDDSVVLMLFGSDRVRFRSGIGTGVTRDPAEAARQAVAAAIEGESEAPALCVLLPDGWQIDVRVVLETVQGMLGHGTLVVGGLADSQQHDRPTRQAHRGAALSESVVCLCFFGPLRTSSAVRAGMRPVGRRHRVTSASGPYVHTIDDRPAVSLWDEYVGAHSLWYPLAVYPEDDDQFYLAASPFTTDDGSAYFWNPVPEGSTVQMADVTQDEIIAAAAEVCDAAVSGFGASLPSAALVFSCSGRKGMLGTRVQEEIDQLRSRLDSRIPIAGFYTAGELCPLPGQTTTRDHGFTFVTVLLGED